MKKIKTFEVDEKTYTEVVKATCCICGKSCMIKLGNENFGYEGMDLEACWGYPSKKDTEIWEAEICEECVDKYLVPLIKFRKKNYM